MTNKNGLSRENLHSIMERIHLKFETLSQYRYYLISNGKSAELSGHLFFGHNADIIEKNGHNVVISHNGHYVFCIEN